MERIKNHDLVQHFKREMLSTEDLTAEPRKYFYEVIDTDAFDATHDCRVVIYKALYDDCRVYTRDYDQFMGEVDRVKYPDIKQQYRFEKIAEL